MLKYPGIISICLSLILPQLTNAQQAEPQISFAQESKSHEYYVEQARLWALELEKDSLSETSWYNYFRACRNAHGSADWRSDFVLESPYLAEGGEVVQRMKNYIPNSFTYYYLSYMTQGIGVNNYDNLLLAYELNPDFPGIESSMISYAESSLNRELRSDVNKVWYKKNYLSSQTLQYNYNVLMSLDTNAILMTQNDNDTYPLWMLQDVLNIREDVMVINIDFLLLDHYREQVFKQLGIPGLNLGEIDLDEYHQNWEKSVKQIINEYSGNKTVYIGMTLFDHLYNDFKDNLFVSGLAFQYSTHKLETTSLNKHLYENVFLLDYVKQNLIFDRNQMNVNYQSANYINSLKVVYDQYKKEKLISKSEEVKSLALKIAASINNPDFEKQVLDAFE